jgi:hypothetical protein
MRAFGRLQIGWLVILCLGCVDAVERSASFSLREEISLGIITVEVRGWEEVPNLHAPINSLRAPAGEKAIAVFVRWSGLDDYAEQDRQAFARSFLSNRLRLRDSEGFEVEAIDAMAKGIYHFLGPVGSAPRDYVVIFHVWVDSEGLTLCLQHPDPQEEGFDVAIVTLA